MSQDREPGWLRPDDDQPGAAALDALGAQHADLVAYCRSVTGQEQVAVSIAGSVLDSAHAMLHDAHRLRAWLFALARTEILAGSAPDSAEVLDLVHRHGIRPEDLAIVLGVAPAEANEILIATEERYGDQRSWDPDDPVAWDPSAEAPGEVFEAQHAHLLAYCHALTGREDAAVTVADAVMGSVHSLLHDPEQLRAWLFALARREMLADALPNAQEVLDLVHGHGIRAEDLPVVLGIPAVEADRLLAAAEDDYASRAFHSGHQDAVPGPGDDWHDGRITHDDRIMDQGAVWDEGEFWADDTDPRGHRLEPGGRHAAPGPGGGIRQVFARGPVRVAAAAGIVVAVIGVSTAYLAAANGPPPSQASQQHRHHPAQTSPSPTSTPSTNPTTSPLPSLAPTQPVTVVQQPAPATTSPRTSPKPSPKPSPSRTTSPSPSASTSPSPSGSPSPSSTH